MKLNCEQIRSCASGIDRIDWHEELMVLHRFTEEQEEMYRATNRNHYVRTRATANVTLEFDTDSPTLALDLSLIPGSGRNIFCHSIFVNGNRIGEISGKLNAEQMEVSGRFDLGEGTKRVKIYFPWSVGSRIRSLRLEDGASFVPLSDVKGKMLIFGDSITQGYTAQRPENTYAIRLAEQLGYEGINKAIGGEVFRPALADLSDPFTPELITVAYGTNDWTHTDAEMFRQNSREFLHALRESYPDTRIVVLAPIWRTNCETATSAGPFRNVAKHLESITAEIGNGVFIDCFDFLPQEQRVMDDHVHPNDEGFDYYTRGLQESALFH